jgi:hypothetical protein
MITSQNVAIYKQQQVLVFTPSGQFLGTWPDAPLLAGFKEVINGATSPLQISLPRAFDNFDQQGAPGSRGTVAQGNVVQYWLYGPNLPSTGLLRFQGIIDSYEATINEHGAQSVNIILTPFDSVLGDHAVTSDAGVTFGTAGQPSTYVDPVAMAKWFFQNNDSLTGIPYMAPLTWAASNPSSSGVTAQFWFTRETMLNCMTSILYMLPPNWFFRVNPDKTFTLNVAPTTAQHIFYVGQNIVNPSYRQDWTQLKNVVVLKYGSPTSSTTYQYVVVNGTDIATFGERVDLEEETRVTDTATATTLADGYLSQNDRVTLRIKVRVPDYRGSFAQPGLGYDIETLHVGDTVQIIDPLSETVVSSTSQSLWDEAHWDVDYWDFAPGQGLSQVVQIQSLSYHFDYVDLELGLMQPSQDRNVFLIEQALNKYIYL